MSAYHLAATLLAAAAAGDLVGAVPPGVFAGVWVAAVVVWIVGAARWLLERSSRPRER